MPLNSYASLFLRNVFAACPLGMAATWAVLCLACMWGLISSQGSVCSSSVMVDQNSEFLCTFRACCEQDTIREFVGRVVGTDCLVLSGPHLTPSVRVVIDSDLTKHYLFPGVLGN